MSKPTPLVLPFLVAHSNPHGHNFVTRVQAETAFEAREALVRAHEGNTILDVHPDHGEPTHAIGGVVYPVVDLNDEP